MAGVEEISAVQVSQLKMLLDHVGAYVFTKDLSGRYTYVNQKVCELFGLSRDEIIGQTDEAFFDLSVFNDLRANDQWVLEHARPLDTEEHNRVASSGEVRVYQTHKMPLFDADKKVVGLCGISTDITERTRMDQQLRQQKELLDNVLDNIESAVYMKDRDQRFRYLNPYTARMLGCDPHQALGKSNQELLSNENLERLQPTDRAVLEEGRRICGEEAFTDPLGTTRQFWTVKIPIREQGEIKGMVGVSSDITEVIELKEKLEQLAHIDEMTGISNRRHLLQGARQELERMKRYQRTLAVIILDIDRFKLINDLYGHAVGDQALIRLVQACQSQLRQVDLFGRLGGDEFVIVLPEVDLEIALAVCERLRHQIANVSIQSEAGDDVFLSSSFGVALSNSHSSLDDLLSRADTALYRAKHAGRNCVEFDERED
ncbi:diguanylate cyclase [Motiliproteus coralliicola]|uniref:Diguanylate cyclase n=1 Tax=Motiliproteus coralliicola TaxID=2283196 RepID=A0A369WEU8_9GAMM|nr:diguanylate cyclase [Motiliproteus coralliicola]RDE19823.1 diguanylate cyclase [Motiliproteus coralliicola]